MDESRLNLEPDAPVEAVHLPAPSVWPLVLSLGVTLLLAGVATSFVFSLVGGVMSLAALVGWVRQLLPDAPQHYEPLAPPQERARPITKSRSRVGQLKKGAPGYRLRLPTEVHPISAGVKGGLVGGLIMPLPALTYGLLSGRGLWYPVNLLAGMLLPNLGDISEAGLARFDPLLFALALPIHAVISLVLGLIYGVLLPTLPRVVGGQLTWGGLLMPLLWSGLCFGLMGVVNPVLQERVDWDWFLVSQFVFGVAAAIVVTRSEKILIPPAGSGTREEQP